MAFARPIPSETWKHGSQKFMDMAKELCVKGLDYHIIKKMAGDTISIQEKMMFEGNRLLSFQSWPSDAKAYAFQLSRSGFYFSGKDDIVTCFMCNGQIGNWQEKDVPMQKHIQRFPNCPFVGGQIAGVNLSPPNLDDDHPTIRLMKHVDKVIKKTSETNRILAARQLSSEMINMTVSINDGQIMARPARTQNMGVTRSAVAFRDENERRKTFEGFWRDIWPVSSKALAQAGFFYCGPEDMVQCAWCYGKLQGWEQGDDPLIEHARHFASCPKYGNRKAVNATSLIKVHHTQGEAGIKGLGDDELGILTVRPSNPQFAIEASRLESYKNKWCSNLTQTPDTLSSAGFFYVGYLDKVKCFFCDGGLCNWEANDEPWTEHARWFPDCGFLKQVKGMTFIQKVKELGINGGPLILCKNSSNMQSSLTSTATKSNSSLPTLLSSEQNQKAGIAKSSPLVTQDGAPLETSMNMDTFSDGANTKFLEEENLKLKEQRLCKICMDEEVSIVLLPCGHLVSCVKCGPALKYCPICRNDIKGTVRVFMA